MCRKLVLALLVMLYAAFGTVCAAEKSDDKDKVTLTINAICEANAAVDENDYHLKDKLTVTLTERATYRIVDDGGGEHLKLELIEHKNSLKAEGGGTLKTGEDTVSWTYSAGSPHTSNCQGGVYIRPTSGRGNIHILNIVDSANIKTNPEESVTLGALIAGMCATYGTSNHPVSPDIAQSNESFLKGLQFSFKPKAKDLQAGGQASYNFTFKGEKGTVGTANLNVTYQVQSGIPEVLEAVIIPKGDYKGWLPLASGAGPNTPGNSISFDVELRGPEGKKAKDKTAQFEIALENTSRYAGTCMNSPWTDSTPDIKIIRENNPKLAEISGDGQTAKTAKGLKSATITLSCFDGAATGKLTVLARIDGEDTVIGAHLEGEPDLTDVSIPYDSDDNGIADAWEKKNDTWGKALNTDEDSEPQGDRHNGDGLTIWEEYRGFQEARKFFRTDPKRKDYFACDNIGGKTQQALNRLKALTKLDVHGKLRLDELSQSRIINRNHGGEDTHVVDQHGVLISTWGTRGVCIAEGDGPGPPGKTIEVLIDSALEDTVTRKLSPTSTRTFPYYIPTVTHELLHTCNVWHHGECDETVYWQAGTVGGVTSIYEYTNIADCGHPEKGTRIQVHLEHDPTMVYRATGPFWANPVCVWLGKKQGQHSGCEDCVMRYDCSTAAVWNASKRFAYIGMNQEPVGQGLCVIGSGTGVNAAGRSPISRYGDADMNRGDCADQICVNDLYHQLEE